MFAAYCLFCSNPATSQVKSGLKAKFTFNNGKCVDEIGPNVPKAIGVSFIKDRFGNANSAVFLHGSAASYVNLGSDESLKPIKGSISLWFNIENRIEAGNGYEINPILLTKCSKSDDFYEAYCIYYLYLIKKVSATITQSELNQVGIHSKSPVTLGSWHHVVFTFDHNYLSFYLDGSLETRLPKRFDNTYLKEDSVMIGNSANAKNKRYFNGAVDDVMFFNRVLNDEEVDKLFHAEDPNIITRRLKWVLIISLFIAVFLLSIYLINKRYKTSLHKEREQNELKNKLYETNMKVLKANMNPHFIFNSLNSIQQFILLGENENASKYLVMFSKLMRKILESNANEYVTLEDEKELLEKYLELESLRFEQTFIYTIDIAPDIILSNVKIPQMLIQPFVENAIWHGLLKKEGEKILTIAISRLDESRIKCVVDDNGVGRQSDSKKKTSSTVRRSLAIEFTKQRLKLLEDLKGIKCGISIIDKQNEIGQSTGTKVEIIIPILIYV